MTDVDTQDAIKALLAVTTAIATGVIGRLLGKRAGMSELEGKLMNRVDILESKSEHIQDALDRCHEQHSATQQTLADVRVALAACQEYWKWDGRTDRRRNPDP